MSIETHAFIMLDEELPDELGIIAEIDGEFSVGYMVAFTIRFRNASQVRTFALHASTAADTAERMEREAHRAAEVAAERLERRLEAEALEAMKTATEGR